MYLLLLQCCKGDKYGLFQHCYGCNLSVITVYNHRKTHVTCKIKMCDSFLNAFIYVVVPISIINFEIFMIL